MSVIYFGIFFDTKVSKNGLSYGFFFYTVLSKIYREIYQNQLVFLVVHIRVIRKVCAEEEAKGKFAQN